MERMLAVIFDSEAKAYEGSRALAEVDRDGGISLHSECVIQKNADGSVKVKQLNNGLPTGTLTGTALGSLIGLLGGPVGVAIGLVAGATVGAFGDLYAADVNVDFLNEVSGSLKPGKFAVLAEISEEWITPVDVRMEALGGEVHRTWREYFEEEYEARQIAALKADIAQLKAELAQAHADRKAKIQAKIDDLNNKLETKREHAKQRSEEIKNQTDAKIKALQQKAAKAQRDTKTAIDNRIAEIKKRRDESAAHLKNAIADQLRKTADQLQKVG